MSTPLPDVTCPKCFLRQMFRNQTACIHRGCTWTKRQLAGIKREAENAKPVSALQASSLRLDDGDWENRRGW